MWKIVKGRGTNKALSNNLLLSKNLAPNSNSTCSNYWTLLPRQVKDLEKEPHDSHVTPVIYEKGKTIRWDLLFGGVE